MFSTRLKYVRQLKKMTQLDLAEKVNTTKATISNYENGYSTPSNDMLVQLAKACHTSTDYLLGVSGSMPVENYDPLEDLKKFLIKHNLQDMNLNFYDIQQWKKLSKEDINEIKRHFEWVVARAENSKE